MASKHLAGGKCLNSAVSYRSMAQSFILSKYLSRLIQPNSTNRPMVFIEKQKTFSIYTCNWARASQDENACIKVNLVRSERFRYFWGRPDLGHI
ncbi:uncharacterized protein H6S33_011777 [Morchella sextelata]|uniref:uncharacterized protein n=1 Tax=Morchella sextelata TaxID=1174677 RepID=UPI001D057686|nr:uncharacterized protein H6S33_011777 [Morchella sextelata]KAH0610250.1 hypothetical protein H6S33_011777 [Morchella sextelata]